MSSDFSNMSDDERIEYLRQKESERNAKIEELTSSQLTNVKTEASQLVKYLQLQGIFDRLSVNNVMLIQSQKPDATCIKSFDDWKSSKVAVKKGEKGILLLRRESTGKYIKDGEVHSGYKFKPYTAFDVSQTNCKPEKPHQYDVEKLARVFGNWLKEKYSTEDIASETVDDKALSLNIFKMIYTELSTVQKYATIIACCATISIATRYALTIDPRIESVLIDEIQKLEMEETIFRKTILEESRTQTREFIEEFNNRLKK